MKRVELKDKELAFLYKGEGSPDPDMPEEAIKKGLQLVADVTSPPLQFINSMLSQMLKREIQGVYIPMDKDGKIYGVTLTGQEIEPAIRALETAVMRLKEARVKEGN